MIAAQNFTRARKLVFVCAWCPDKATRDAAAAAAGHDVTHGLCPLCYTKQMRQLVEIIPPVPERAPIRFSCRLRHRAQLSPL